MTPFEAGTRIGGRYRLLRKLGEGGMGVVWSARNESTDRDFALKLMLPEAATNARRIERFLKEAKAAGRLRHRSIVEVYDLGIIGEPGFGDAPYLVMELLDGEPLDLVVRRLGKLPAGTALRIVGDVARALEVAHRSGIVHRDLKPANLFLHRSLEGGFVPKVLDFGISKLIGRDDDDGVKVAPEVSGEVTLVGTVVGSPAYMSPEQAAGEPDVDGRSDIWSLGVILYRCLSGALPFSGQRFEDLAREIHRKVPRPLGELVAGLPPEVEALVHQCLAKDRARRFQSARALGDAIDELLERHVLPTLELSRVITLTALGADLRRSERMATRISCPTAETVDAAPSLPSLPSLQSTDADTDPMTRPPSPESSGSETRELAPTAPSIERAERAEPSEPSEPSERATAAPSTRPSAPPRAPRLQRWLPLALASLVIATIAVVGFFRRAPDTTRSADAAHDSSQRGSDVATAANAANAAAGVTEMHAVATPGAGSARRESNAPPAASAASAAAERPAASTKPAGSVAGPRLPTPPRKPPAAPIASAGAHEGVTNAGF